MIPTGAPRLGVHGCRFTNTGKRRAQRAATSTEGRPAPGRAPPRRYDDWLMRALKPSARKRRRSSVGGARIRRQTAELLDAFPEFERASLLSVPADGRAILLAEWALAEKGHCRESTTAVCRKFARVWSFRPAGRPSVLGGGNGGEGPVILRASTSPPFSFSPEEEHLDPRAALSAEEGQRRETITSAIAWQSRAVAKRYASASDL